MTKNLKTIPIEVVKYYLTNGSLRKTAKEFGIHYNTLYKWVKLYKNGGKEYLKFCYKRPWNRTSKEIEEKIYLLKEEKPYLTLKEAQRILKEDGINISIKGIWNIWKRYGFAGFKKENMTNDFTEYCEWTKEASVKFQLAEKFFEKGNINLCIDILNSIPFLPKNSFLPKLPDRFLNLRRKVEKYHILFGKLPINFYLKRTEILYKLCRLRNLNYSALRIGTRIVIALEWKGESYKQIKKIKELKSLMKKNRNLYETTFTVLISEGIANASLLKIKSAKEIAKRCYEMLKRVKNPSPYFLFDLGVLYYNLENYKKAKYYFLKSLNKVDEITKKFIFNYLARISLFEGNQKSLNKFLKNSAIYDFFSPHESYLFSSYLSLMRGKPIEAISFVQKGLSILEKEKIRKDIFLLSLCGAAAYSSIGERQKGVELLREILLYPSNYISKKVRKIVKNLISEKSEKILKEDVLPSIKFLIIFKEKNLKNSFKYSIKHGIKLFYYIYNLLFPEKVIRTLKNGNKVYLPKKLLNFPIFDLKPLVYKIKFLGDFRIYRDKKYLKLNLFPKEKAFIIHLAIRIPEPDKKIIISDILRNFWPNSQKSSNIFSTYLYKVKNILKIPPRLISISKKEDLLINKGLYFITDFSDFEIKLAEFETLLKINMWEFCKRKFKEIIKLFKDKPLKKLYDNWSEDLRLKILFKLKKAFDEFFKECIRKKDFKIMYKFSKIKKQLI